MPRSLQAERDILGGAPPGQKRVVLKQKADFVLVDTGSTVPADGACNPMMARRMVLLPEPDGPTRLTNSPSSTSMVTLSRTCVAP